MNQENNEMDFLNEEETSIIDVKKYISILMRHWKKLLWWVGGGFVLGCLIALGTPHSYRVVTKLAPELSSTAASRMLSVSSLMGLSSSMMGSTDAIYPMVYPDILSSPEFIAELFKTPIDFVYKKDSVHTDLYDYMMNYGSKSIPQIVIQAPFKAVGWFIDLFKAEEEELTDSTIVDSFRFTKDQEMVYRTLKNSIEASVDKKTLVVTVSVTMDNALITAILAKAVNDQLKSYITKYRTEKAIIDRDYYKKLYEDAKKDYYLAQKEYFIYSDSHQSMILKSVTIESERLRNESNLAYQLYTSSAQQLQSAEAKIQQETPVFAEIITPTVPSQSINSRKKMALTFAFLGFIAGVIFVCFKNRKEELE